MRNSLLFAIVLLFPGLALAHEVYVLTPAEISYGTSTAAFNMLAVAQQNLGQFFFWGFIVFVAVSTVFFVSMFHVLERLLDPFFGRARPYAQTVCRTTVGLGLIAGAVYGATYGPELPLAAFGMFAPVVAAAMALVGLCFLLDFRAREASYAALALFAVGVFQHGVYMLTYVNYLGEFLVLAFVVGQSVPKGRRRARLQYEPAIIRIGFGLSLLYSSLYAKILHNELALQVASLPLSGHAHSLAYYFGFEPHFLVLGAALIEMLIALFFIFGIEVRWTCIFLEFWLALSLWYFGESVWPHLILIGIPIALFIWGYDRYSIEGRFFKRGKLEPVL